MLLANLLLIPSQQTFSYHLQPPKSPGLSIHLPLRSSQDKSHVVSHSLELSDFMRRPSLPGQPLSLEILGSCGSNMTQQCPLSSAYQKWVCFLANFLCVLKLFSENAFTFLFSQRPARSLKILFHLQFSSYVAIFFPHPISYLVIHSPVAATCCHLLGYFNITYVIQPLTDLSFLDLYTCNALILYSNFSHGVDLQNLLLINYFFTLIRSSLNGNLSIQLLRT